MSVVRWRRAAAVSILALMAIPFAQAADAPAAPGTAAPAAAAAPASAATLPTGPPSASAPTRIAVPIPTDPVADASEPESMFPDLLAPLRKYGVESWRDVFQLQPWTGTLGFTFDDQEQRIRAPGSPTQTFSNRLLTESATLSNDNFAIIDPRLFTGSLSLGVSFQQGWQQSLGLSQHENATLDTYAFDGTFLPESPYNLNLFAVKSQSTYIQPSGSATHTDIQNQGVAFQLRETSVLRDKEILPYFSANFRAFQQFEKQTTTYGGQSFKQDDRRDQIAFGFQNGGENSDLTFQYQYTKLDNFAYTDGSYNSQNANAYYSIDFGPTLNWRSDSRLNYYLRNGTSPGSNLDTLDINEFLTIDHSTNLSSNYNYQLTRQSAEVGTATTQSFGAQFNQQVFHNLSLTEGLTAVYSTLPGGTISSAGVAGSFNYGHVVPWQGQLSLAGGGGYLITSSEVPAGVVPVVDAPYVVPPIIGAGAAILLRDRNIETASIIVVVLKGATRVTAVLDVDYTVQVNGDQTSLVPLATSALMQPGDPLNVSYVFQVAPNSKFQTTSGSASIGIDWPWFGFNLSHDQTDQTPISGGDDTLLVSERRDAGLVYVRGNWDEVQARAAAGVTSYDSLRLTYVERRVDVFMTYAPYQNLSFNLALNESRTNYQNPVHSTTNDAARFDAQWSWGPWQTSAYASWRRFVDTQQPTETIAEAGLRLRRTWTKLDVNFFAAIQQRTKGDIVSPNGIVHLAVIRRF
jgi:hypothetical protein